MGQKPIVDHRRLIAVAPFGVPRSGSCVLDHRDLEALLEQLAQMGFEAHVRQHAAEDDLADASLAQLQNQIVRLRSPYLVRADDDTDRIVNTTEENIDIAIRVGVLPDSSMIATRIGSIRIVVCASPSYLNARGQPKQLADLGKHDCITIDDHATPSSWKFVRGGRARIAPIKSRLCVNTSEAAVLAAVNGAGLARVMSYKMDAAERAGKLAIVLEEFEPEPLPVHIMHTPRKPAPLKLRAFLKWMTPRLKARLAFA